MIYVEILHHTYRHCVPGIDACMSVIHLFISVDERAMVHKIQLIVDELWCKLDDWLRCKNGICHCCARQMVFPTLFIFLQYSKAKHSSLDCRAIKYVLVSTKKNTHTLRSQRPFIKLTLFWIHSRVEFRQQFETAKKQHWSLFWFVCATHTFYKRLFKQRRNPKYWENTKRHGSNLNGKSWTRFVWQNRLLKFAVPGIPNKWCSFGLCGGYCWLWWWWWCNDLGEGISCVMVAWWKHINAHFSQTPSLKCFIKSNC